MKLLTLVLIILLLPSCARLPIGNGLLTPTFSQDSDNTKYPTYSPNISSTPTTSKKGTCGIGINNNDVLIWVAGDHIEQVCKVIIENIRSRGEQPIEWSGNIYYQYASDYGPICSDQLKDFAYEVIDTNSYSSGSDMCAWIVSQFGASGEFTNPDLFSIISSARNEAISINSTQEYSKQATEVAKEQNQKATENARDQNYRASCKDHNGYISENGNCVVDYPGWSSQRVAINYDGSWNAEQADSEKRECDIHIADANMGASEGHPWTIFPEYHSDTGVCARGGP